jgi:hypothetical protein
MIAEPVTINDSLIMNQMLVDRESTTMVGDRINHWILIIDLTIQSAFWGKLLYKELRFQEMLDPTQIWLDR